MGGWVGGWVGQLQSLGRVCVREQRVHVQMGCIHVCGCNNVEGDVSSPKPGGDDARARVCVSPALHSFTSLHPPPSHRLAWPPPAAHPPAPLAKNSLFSIHH